MRILTIILCLFLVSCNSPAPKLDIESGSLDQLGLPVKEIKKEVPKQENKNTTKPPVAGTAPAPTAAFRKERDNIFMARIGPAKNPNLAMAAAPETPAGGSAPIINRDGAPDTAKKPSAPSTTPKTEIKSQLYSASLVFAVPEKANINDDVYATLLIDPSKEVEELAALATNKGIRTKTKIKVSNIILAKLTAPDFNVTLVTPEEQALTDDEPTEWIWYLDPKQPGIYSINLSVTAVVQVDGKTSVHNLRTFNKTIQIEVKPQQVAKTFLEKYWQWFMSTLIIPLGLWVYKEKIKKPKKIDEVT